MIYDSWEGYDDNHVHSLFVKSFGKDFVKKWYNYPNNELDGATPIQVINEGKQEVVSTLIWDMLSGNPS